MELILGILRASVRPFEFRSDSDKCNGHQERKITLKQLKKVVIVSFNVLLLEDTAVKLQTSLFLHENNKLHLLSGINITIRCHQRLLRRNEYGEGHAKRVKTCIKS
jgi:hypothetical protein